MKITAHCIVKNEDQWIYFALMSVLPYVDQILIYDTGSTDNTVAIIKSIKSTKISFEEKGVVDKSGMTKLRNEQIKETKTEWFMLLDGDEIWPSTQLKKLLDTVKNSNKKIKAFFVRTKNSIGDIYHFLPDNSGRYEIAGMKGHLNMRFFRNSKVLKVIGDYPLEYYGDDQGSLQSQVERIKFVDCWYMHTSHLKRSSKDKSKTSGSFAKKKIWEKGIKIEKKDLPEVLFQAKSERTLNSLKKRGLIYETVSTFTTPLLNLKRKIK